MSLQEAMVIDYSLYLVTDETPAILGARSLEQVVKDAVAGGVTVVQYRDKHGETARMIEMAKTLRAICESHSIPLIINDRVDVALASNAHGVHLGQEDMDPLVARQMLGPRAIIGATVSSCVEATAAVNAGADYLGMGTVYATPTKEDTKSIIGIAGVREILQAISKFDKKVPAVAIGGINSKNAQRVMYHSEVRDRQLNGLAVVSAIIAAKNPTQAASELRRLIKTSPAFVADLATQETHVSHLLGRSNNVIKTLGQQHPLCHNMTNLVVQNFAANVALAIGSSPIMANSGDEAPELAALGGALVVNMGSVTPDAITNYVKAVQAYNACNQPVLLDPVGAGATGLRRAAVKTLMNGGFYTVIKGNENEIRVLLGDISTQQKGVDSGASTSSEHDKAVLARKLAERCRNVVVLTGKVDYVSDEYRTYAVKNGHVYLGLITGSGCTLGTTIAACLAAYRADPLLATLSGMLMFEIAAEQASVREHVKGPGTFVPAFLDELYEISQLAEKSDESWLESARVEAVDIPDTKSRTASR